MKSEKKRILFYIAQNYYWTSMEPIYEAFRADEHYDLALYLESNSKRVLKVIPVSQKKKLEKKYHEKGYTISKSTKGYDAVFCGAPVKKPKRFGDAILCNVDHGPGIKTLRYRHFLKQPDTQYVCFLEGPYRLDKFKKYGLDKIEAIYDVGLPKLDVFFNGFYNRERIIKHYGLDPHKKTVLYAPSYKPTSIFDIGEQVVQLSGRYNVVVKLHPYSWAGKYASHNQHLFFENLKDRYPDFFLAPEAEHNILPFMFIADTMISDGSSVINEFLALERCGIIYNLNDDQLKHHDGQPLLEDKSSQWLQDAFIHINDPSQIEQAVGEALNPTTKRLEQIKKDKAYIFSYTDGRSSRRVKQTVDALLKQKG